MKPHSGLFEVLLANISLTVVTCIEDEKATNHYKCGESSPLAENTNNTQQIFAIKVQTLLYTYFIKKIKKIKERRKKIKKLTAQNMLHNV